MVENFKNIIDVISKAIARDVKQGKNLSMLLGAFNQWQEDERSGVDYIFDINNKEDLKYLVDNGMITATGIAWVVQNCYTGMFQFNGEPDAGIQPISPDVGIQPISVETLNRYLIINAGNYLPYVIMYAARCGSDSAYAKVYEEYITEVLERSKFNPSNY